MMFLVLRTSLVVVFPLVPLVLTSPVTVEQTSLMGCQCSAEPASEVELTLDVEDPSEVLRQQSYALKNQLGHPKNKLVFLFALRGSLWHKIVSGATL